VGSETSWLTASGQGNVTPTLLSSAAINFSFIVGSVHQLMSDKCLTKMHELLTSQFQPENNLDYVFAFT